MGQYRHRVRASATVFATRSSLAALPVTMECVADHRETGSQSALNKIQIGPGNIKIENAGNGQHRAAPDFDERPSAHVFDPFGFRTVADDQRVGLPFFEDEFGFSLHCPFTKKMFTVEKESDRKYIFDISFDFRGYYSIVNAHS